MTPTRRRAALYAALCVLVLALSGLAWTASSGNGRPDGEEATEAGAGPKGGSGSPTQQADTQRPSGARALVTNPLYSTGRLSPLPCPAPDLEVDDPGSMERFLTTVADCLDDTWSAQFAKAGISFEPPGRGFWTEPGTSPCRDYPSSAGAFYCRTDQTVYIGTADVAEKWGGEENSAVYASLLAHEYAHHVQGEAGLLEYYHEQRRREDDPAEQSAWTRKSELQANCLSGAFLGAVEVSYPLDDADREAVLEDAAATADEEDAPPGERTHGNPDNSRLWLHTGMEKQAPGACNTWAVSNDELLR
ncbi:hypothetical protein FHX37_4321 [Haloactinospora alba]|uniref:Metalloprotease n=1 Tax=Haloactinospora alba TaxID=405555 RepID=A0A543N6Y2_9ACTN|nr:neutral zinc metallopeptidase [Haloactinospora alba]TQN27599.1 hypothetical protein FHX37_4321 [Haloactinospora alba]